MVKPAIIVMREIEKSKQMRKIGGTDETYFTKYEGKNIPTICVVFKAKFS